MYGRWLWSIEPARCLRVRGSKKEAKLQATQTLQQQEVFAKAWQQCESELRSIEGPSDVSETVDDSVAIKGLAITAFGVLKMTHAHVECQDALYDRG
jgi:hypothetical protein